MSKVEHKNLILIAEEVLSRTIAFHGDVFSQQSLFLLRDVMMQALTIMEERSADFQRAFEGSVKEANTLAIENARFLIALNKIASCQSYHEGDLVDIAQKALKG